MGIDFSYDLDDILFNFFGWTYLIAWTALFYPQIRLNFKNKSCAGVSRIYVLYNTFGFACYTVYNVTRKVIQDQNGLARAVSVHDVLFAVHNLVCCLILCAQLSWYERGNETVSKFDWIMLLLLILTTLLSFVSSAAGFTDWATTEGFACKIDCTILRQFSFIQVLGYVKVAVTLLKYPSQIKLNYIRKSTQGLSFSTYILDSCGGTCSVLQNVTHAWLKNDMEYIEGNIPKLCLGSLSFMYDIVILIQIRCYSKRKTYISVETDETEVAVNIRKPVDPTTLGVELQEYTYDMPNSIIRTRKSRGD